MFIILARWVLVNNQEKMEIKWKKRKSYEKKYSKIFETLVNKD